MSRPLTSKFVSIIYFFYSRNGKLGACVVSMSFLNTLCGTDWRKHLLVTWVRDSYWNRVALESVGASVG